MIPFYIFDIEANGLLKEATEIHCLSYRKYINGELMDKKSMTDPSEIKSFFGEDAYYVGHNICMYDIPLVEKLLGVKMPEKLFDTLGICWYLFPYIKKPGLEYWGNLYGVKKPKVEDWENLGKKVYVHRCERDVKINTMLFLDQFKYLISIYGSFSKALRIVGYISFKMDCLREQEAHGIDLDMEKAEEHFEKTTEMFDEKTEVLSSVMPEWVGKVLKEKPKKPFKKDGTLSSHGEKWYRRLYKEGLPVDTEVIREKPNPASHVQLKKWLFDLDWEPDIYKTSDSTGEEIPQISKPFGGGISDSVKDLYEKEPNLKELENYYVIQHRKGIFESYLDKEKDGKVIAGAKGFTNTMRLKHGKPIVNLPGVDKFYGQQVRECLKRPEGDYLMCGSDVSSLEDSTKQHYIYFFDPDYVREMQVPGFDPHLDIGKLAGLLSEEEEVFYKWADNQDRKNLSKEDLKKYNKIKSSRKVSKTTNFSATYNAGPPKISKTAKITLAEGKKLFNIYWERNWAIKKIAKACKVKTVVYEVPVKYEEEVESVENGEVTSKTVVVRKKVKKKQRWLYNPVSKMWLMLREDKDRFSTLNQSTGVYVVDSWIRKARGKLKKIGVFVIMQYHDEILLVCKKEQRKEVHDILHWAMDEVNKELKLNVDISVTDDWGDNYAECH